jgi:hypothetical protein
MLRAAHFLIPALALLAVPASAEPKVETLFSKVNWTTERVTFDDGDVGCVAEVKNQNGTEVMSFWRFKDTYRLQFYSKTWNFGESGTSDVNLKVDDLKSWDLKNSDLYKNSVLFDLPTGKENGARFVAELRGGKFIVLQGAGAVGYRNYSLLGADEAIKHLESCKF